MLSAISCVVDRAESKGVTTVSLFLLIGLSHSFVTSDYVETSGSAGHKPKLLSISINNR